MKIKLSKIKSNARACIFSNYTLQAMACFLEKFTSATGPPFIAYEKGSSSTLHCCQSRKYIPTSFEDPLVLFLVLVK